MLWGRVEDGKDEEPIFKLGYTELEFDYNNLPEKDMISYSDFINRKFQLKTETDIPEEDYRTAMNQEIT